MADEAAASGGHRRGDRRRDERRSAVTPALRADGGSGAVRGGQTDWLSLNNWSVLAHPMLLDQIERLVAASVNERATLDRPASGPNTKLLGHLAELVHTAIPRDPGSKEFRHGGTLRDRAHWFRAKTGNGRYRLFYRFDSRTRTIILVWVNDEHTLRTYGRKTDAYQIFAQMLDSGNPPDSWEALKAAAADPTQVARLAEWVKAVGTQPTPPARAESSERKPRKRRR